MTETILNLGCGTDHHEDAHNVDNVPDCEPDEVYDLTEYPWPWDGVKEIRMFHVLEHMPDIEGTLRECARILKPGARLTVKLPMGRDAYADSTHTWGKRGIPWTWRTPDFYCGSETWSGDIDLYITSKNVELWSIHPTQVQKAYHQKKWNVLLELFGPGEWCFDVPMHCGEFTITFRK